VAELGLFGVRGEWRQWPPANGNYKRKQNYDFFLWVNGILNSEFSKLRLFIEFPFTRLNIWKFAESMKAAYFHSKYSSFGLLNSAARGDCLSGPPSPSYAPTTRRRLNRWFDAIFSPIRQDNWGMNTQIT